MRTWGWVGLLTLALGSAAAVWLWQRDAPVSPTPSRVEPPVEAEAARAFIDAHRANDREAQETLVAEMVPDAWRVAEHIVLQGGADALAIAKSLAALAPENQAGGLADYLARPGLVERWRRALPALHRTGQLDAPIADDPYLSARALLVAEQDGVRAHALATQAVWPEGIADAHYAQGDQASRVNEAAKAATAFAHAFNAYNACDRLPMALHALMRHGSEVANDGQLLEGVKWLQFVVDAEHAHPIDKADALRNQAVAYQRLDRAADTAKAYQAALKLYEALGETREIAITRSYLAGYHARLGDTETSLALARDAESQLKAKPDLEYAALLVNRALAYQIGGRLEEALSTLDAARSLAEAAGDRRVLSFVLHHIGACRLRLEQEDEATEALRAAARTAQRSRDPQERALIEISLGRLALRRDLDRAHELFESAKRQGEALGSDYIVVSALGGLAEQALLQRRYADAVRICLTARDRIPELALGVTTRAGAHLRAIHADIYDLGLRACLRIDDVVGAFQFLESGRAGQLVKDLRARASTSNKAVDRYRDGLARLAAGVEAGSADLAKTRAQVETLRNELAKADPTRALREISLEATQRSLESHQVLLLFGRAGARCVVGVIRNDDAALVDQCDWEALQDACRDFTGTAAPEDIDGARSLLLRGLLRPSDTHVLVSPIDTLFRVPFGALLPERTTTWIPAAAVWRYLQRRESTAHQEILGIGDVPARGKLARLASGALRTFASKLITGDDATPARVLGALREPRRAVHFACHALIDRKDGFASRLVLAGRDEDHVLRVADVLETKIDCDLVFLSACRSGDGRPMRGEGLMGFARAFLVAGARRVVVSLWPVRDQDAEQFAKIFYERYRGETSASEALREARKSTGHQAWALWGRSD